MEAQGRCGEEEACRLAGGPAAERQREEEVDAANHGLPGAEMPECRQLHVQLVDRGEKGGRVLIDTRSFDDHTTLRGRLIGKGGENVRFIQSQTGVRVTFPNQERGGLEDGRLKAQLTCCRSSGANLGQAVEYLEDLVTEILEEAAQRHANARVARGKRRERPRQDGAAQAEPRRPGAGPEGQGESAADRCRREADEYFQRCRAAEEEAERRRQEVLGPSSLGEKGASKEASRSEAKGRQERQKWPLERPPRESKSHGWWHGELRDDWESASGGSDTDYNSYWYDDSDDTGSYMVGDQLLFGDSGDVETSDGEEEEEEGEKKVPAPTVEELERSRRLTSEDEARTQRIHSKLLEIERKHEAERSRFASPKSAECEPRQSEIQEPEPEVPARPSTADASTETLDGDVGGWTTPPRSPSAVGSALPLDGAFVDGCAAEPQEPSAGASPAWAVHTPSTVPMRARDADRLPAPSPFALPPPRHGCAEGAAPAPGDWGSGVPSGSAMPFSEPFADYPGLAPAPGGPGGLRWYPACVPVIPVPWCGWSEPRSGVPMDLPAPPWREAPRASHCDSWPLEHSYSVERGTYEVTWRVESRKLQGGLMRLISPPFELCLGSSFPCTVFKLMLFPQAPRSRTTSSRCFLRTRGWGGVQLKCEADICHKVPDVRFHLWAGPRAETQRAAVRRHDFSRSALFEAPEVWDFAAAAGADGCFRVRLEVLRSCRAAGSRAGRPDAAPFAVPRATGPVLRAAQKEIPARLADDACPVDERGAGAAARSPRRPSPPPAPAGKGVGRGGAKLVTFAAAEGAPVCKFWLKGSCKFGEGCRSAHPPLPLPTTAPGLRADCCRVCGKATDPPHWGNECPERASAPKGGGGGGQSGV